MEQTTIAFDEILDVQGLKCPMPLVKSRRAVGDIPVGNVLKVVATDRGSVTDFQGWAKTAKNMELLEQEEVQENGTTLYVHYLRRTK